MGVLKKINKHLQFGGKMNIWIILTKYYPKFLDFGWF